MTIKNTLEILKEMKADPKAKELFESMEKPTSPDEMVAAYAQVAEKLGYNITAEDIREAAKQEDARRKAKTDKVVSDMEALEDDDLEDVAGGSGKADECVNTVDYFVMCDDNDHCWFDSNTYYCYSYYAVLFCSDSLL